MTAALFGDGASSTTCDSVEFLDNSLAIIFVTQLISQLLHWFVNYLVGLPEAVPWDISVIVTAGLFNDKTSTVTGGDIAAIIFVTYLINQFDNAEIVEQVNK